jgi:hypothetical protein
MHYLIQVRDTLQFTLDKEIPAELFNQRKQILTKGIEPNSHLGNFLDNNKEQGDKIKEKLNEFIDEIYGENSTILSIHDNVVRVDHTQHIKMLDYVVGLSESVRDIIYGYVNHARANNALEDQILELVAEEDRFYRVLSYMIIIKEFQKSFVEFQKVMSESQGKPSPQSNYIVQNELQKLSAMVRFIRNHVHCTDNPTLDLLDKTIQLLEMTEGRRDRRDNKSFKDLFDEINKELAQAVAQEEPKYNAVFKKNLDEFLAELKKGQQDQQA